MTRMRALTPPDPVRPGDPLPAVKPRPRLAPYAPHVAMLNRIGVSSSDDILTEFKDERERRYHLLVRKFINQLLYGCQNPTCDKPTCFSYQRRVAKAPRRRLTPLSARTVACVLANEKDLENALCHNKPAVPLDIASHKLRQRRKPVSRLTSTGKQSTSSLQSANCGVAPDYAQPIRFSEGQMSVTSLSHSSEDIGDDQINMDLNSVNRGERLHSEQVAGAPNGRQDHMKDNKSFTQNLFDTVALRMLEWVPLRRPLKAQTVPEHHESENRPADIDEGTFQENRHVVASSVPNAQGDPGKKLASIYPNGHAISPLKPRGSLEPEEAAGFGGVSHRQDVRASVGATEDNEVHLQAQSDPEDASPSESQNDEDVARESPSTPSAHEALRPPSRKHRRKQGDSQQSKYARSSRVSDLDSRICPILPSNEESEEDLRQKYADILDSLPISAATMLDQVPSPMLAPTEPIETLSHLSVELLIAIRQMMFHEDGDDVLQKWLGGPTNPRCRLGFRPQDWKHSTRRQNDEVIPFAKQSLFYVLKEAGRLLKSFRKLNGQSRDAPGPDPLGQLDPPSMIYSFQTIHLLQPYAETVNALWHTLAPLYDPPAGLPKSAQSRRRARQDSKPKEVRGLAVNDPSKPFESPVSSLSDSDAAYICTIVLYALATLIPPISSCQHNAESWNAFRKMRSTGRIFPHTEMEKLEHRCQSQWLLELTDRFEDELALRLLDHMVGAINNRLVYYEISRARTPRGQTNESKRRKPLNVVQLVLKHLQRCNELNGRFEPSTEIPSGIMGWAYHRYPAEQNIMSTATLEWLRTLMLKEWDGKPQTRRAGTVGSIIQILAAMFKERVSLGLLPEDFHTSFFSERLDSMEMPVEWLASRPGDNNTIHLLSYSFLFPPAAVVTYFRSLNFSTMSKAYETALTTSRHAHQRIYSDFIPIHNDSQILENLEPATATFLVLTIRRDNVLTDAMNQIWRREKRELMRPLKVRMGMEEGEEGIDHGGVQQEFFRVLFGQALDPSYGMFTTDPTTRMLWFRPSSLEPLWKFEMLGLFVSIAVYNSITLPVTFPLAFYRKLLSQKIKTLEHIADGWPDLARGFEMLLSWSEGDVGDLFARTYEFSYEAYGTVVNVDMEKVDGEAYWPPPRRDKGKEKAKTATFDFPGLQDSDEDQPILNRERKGKHVPRRSHSSKTEPSPILHPKSSMRTPSIPVAPDSEASVVTNENRAQFVKDYIFWLTDKSVRPQYEAFARGFYTCLDRTALSIFTPEALKTVVEGLEEINVEELERTTKYDDGYNANHRVIRDFWYIVNGFGPEKKRKLLEFVTASDRVPVNGISSIQFIIQRNGTDDKRLPTSLTCFGRLLLPEYSSRQALEDKLNKAIENATGFGVA